MTGQRVICENESKRDSHFVSERVLFSINWLRRTDSGLITVSVYLSLRLSTVILFLPDSKVNNLERIILCKTGTSAWWDLVKKKGANNHKRFARCFLQIIFLLFAKSMPLPYTRSLKSEVMFNASAAQIPNLESLETLCLNFNLILYLFYLYRNKC